MDIYFLFSKRSLYFYAKVMATLIILFVLMHYSQLKVELFSTIFYKPFVALAVIGLFYLGVLANTWRWYRLNSAQAIKLSFTQSIGPTYVGIAFNNVLPGSVGGDIIRCFYILKRFPGRKSGAVLSTLIDRVCGLIGIIIISCVIASYKLDTLSHNHYLYSLALICFSVCALVFLFFCLSLILPERMGLGAWLEKKLNSYQWLGPIMPILKAINVYKQSKWIILECLIMSIITQLLLLAAVLLISTMMGLPTISPFDYMLALAIGQIANLVPLTPGGIGIGEAAFANIVLMLNPGSIGAYATVFFALRLLMAIAYAPGVLLGIFGLNVLRKGKDLSPENVS